MSVKHRKPREEVHTEHKVRTEKIEKTIHEFSISRMYARYEKDTLRITNARTIYDDTLRVNKKDLSDLIAFLEDIEQVLDEEGLL
jgi:hypothetical protein